MSGQRSHGDLLSGLVVALALNSEAIAFSIIAVVLPRVGLYASLSIAVLIAFVGGRPGMISTAATAVLMVSLVRDHGLEYLLPATVLAGLIQIDMAQLPELGLSTPGETWLTWALVAAGLGIIYLFPRPATAVPSPLVTVVVLTGLNLLMGRGVQTVGDLGALPDTLPVFLIPDVPPTLETLCIILPYSAAIAVVGLLECLMTQNIVDELTDTTSDRDKECTGQGIANTATGFIGGMAGCAIIGQSIITVKFGGRGRLSAFAAGTVLLILVVGPGDLVGMIPMPALVAIMIMVSIGTFSWSSLRNVASHPRSSSMVMLVAVAGGVWTHNLAIGVLVGVMLSGMFFATKIAQLFRSRSVLSEDGRERTYIVEGQLFYGSAEAFAGAFDLREAIERVTIDVSHAHIWDISSAQALDVANLKCRRAGAEVRLIGMNEASETLVDKLALHDKPGALDKLTAH